MASKEALAIFRSEIAGNRQAAWQTISELVLTALKHDHSIIPSRVRTIVEDSLQFQTGDRALPSDRLYTLLMIDDTAASRIMALSYLSVVSKLNGQKAGGNVRPLEVALAGGQINAV